MSRNPNFPSMKPLLAHFGLSRPVDWPGQFGRQAPLEVEIGSGLGEFIVRQAAAFPDSNFVGIEYDWKRVYKILQRIGQSPAGQIRIFQYDAELIFERFFQPRSIDRIYCLFPCPWPKKKHIKHRLFDHAFFELLNSRLKDGGEIQMVTDYAPYRDWVEEEAADTGFKLKTGVIRPRYDTKFERKWMAGGQEEFFELQFIKDRHIPVPFKEDTLLKTYRLKTFDPQQFRPADDVGETSVIFKEVIRDISQEKVMVRTVVAEQDITQHFWIMILKTPEGWLICPSDGCPFIPTPGIQRALDLAAQAAQAH